MGNFKLSRSHRGLDHCYWNAHITKHQFSWLQGQTHSFGLFARIDWKVFFQAQPQAWNAKHIFWQPEIAYRYKFKCF